MSESRRGYKLARSSLLVSTPQSRLTPCQLPVRGAFWFVQPPTQKPALKGEVAMSDSELTEGLHRGCSFFPQPLSRLAATAPRPGSLLALCNSAQKPAPKGEVAMSDSELTEGLHRSCSFFPSTPQSPVGDSSPSGEPFSTVQAHCTVPYPSRSDRFNGVTGGAGGLRGEIEIFPGPPAKKHYIFPSFSSSQRFFTRKVATWLPWLPRPKPSSAPLARACAEAT